MKTSENCVIICHNIGTHHYTTRFYIVEKNIRKYLRLITVYYQSVEVCSALWYYLQNRTILCYLKTRLGGVLHCIGPQYYNATESNRVLLPMPMQLTVIHDSTVWASTIVQPDLVIDENKCVFPNYVLILTKCLNWETATCFETEELKW